MDIVSYCKYNPRSYTYVGIGSKNRVDVLEDFHKDMDQILPCFIWKVQSNTIRCLHFDEQFGPEFDKGFLSKYFTSKGFRQEKPNIWLSSDSRIEVIIVPENLNDNNFLYKMMCQALQFSTKLVVQKFNGGELVSIFQSLYEKFNDDAKAYIKHHVLFDITYGVDCHCHTPMTQYEPLLDKNGNFYNFILYNEVEILKSIGLLPKMDKLIADYFNKKLSKLLNEEHVNYRKAVRGEEFLFPTRFTKPHEIMNNLLLEIKSILTIQEKLGILTDEKRQIFSEHSKNYSEIDMYKWYSNMTKLYK